MTGHARKERSKWDTKEHPDIVEISEDESLPANKDEHCDTEKQLCESSNLKSDTSMHHRSAGQEQIDSLNKDAKEMQSKASSDRSQPRRMADEHANNDWGKAAGNQGANRYADDRRRGDGWGTALARGYSSRMSSDPDTWRQRSRSPSPRAAWNRSRRNRSRSRSPSRSRNRSRSRSRSRGRGRGRSRSRSRSPYFADRGSDWRIERGRTSGGPPLPCRDFVAGRCRRGMHCRFLHEDVGHRQFEEHYPAGPRERYGHQNREFMDPREQDDFLRSRPSRGLYDEGTWERSEPRRDYRSTELCHNFVKGRCIRGTSCRFSHDDSASHGGWRNEGRENAHDRVGPDSSYGNRPEHRRVNKNPCKFFADGRCRRGQNCPYLHEDPPQTQMALGAPDEPLKYGDGHATRGSYSNWGEQSNAMHANSQILPREGRENPVSQSMDRSDSLYEQKNQHLKDGGPGRSQYQIIPHEDFGSKAQNKPDVAASQQAQFLNPVQTSEDSMNNDKTFGMDGQSAPETAGSLSMQIGMHGSKMTAEQNLGQILQSEVPVPSDLPVTTQFQNVTTSMPSNSHMQQSSFSVRPNQQEQFIVPQSAPNNSTPSLQGQAVAPHMGHSQHGYGLGSQTLPDLAAHNGHSFNIAGQIPQNLPGVVHSGQSQATIDLPMLSQDRGAPSIQNMQNFQTVAPNVQTQGQSLQGLSLVPNSSTADMAGAPVSHNAAKSEEERRRVTASLAQYFGNAALSAATVGLQSSQPNMNSSLMVTSSAAPPPPAVQPNSWPWAQQQAGMVQPALPVPPEQHQQPPQAFQMPMAVGSSNGNSVLLPHSVAPSGQPAGSVVNETVPSENKKAEAKDSDAEAHEDGDNKKGKDSKALKMFKVALADFVKEALKPTWKEGQLTREIHKTIVKKVVDKVTSTVENTPPTKEKIDIYMSFSKEKLNKLVQAYVGKYVKT
ncbi:hypothetical protein ACP70R_002886 [Stipagrostis hirtigluma subsp. patula]